MDDAAATVNQDGGESNARLVIDEYATCQGTVRQVLQDPASSNNLRCMALYVVGESHDGKQVDEVVRLGHFPDRNVSFFAGHALAKLPVGSIKAHGASFIASSTIYAAYEFLRVVVQEQPDQARELMGPMQTRVLTLSPDEQKSFGELLRSLKAKLK